MLLGLSSCVSFNNCNNKDQKIKAGLYIYEVLETAYSDKSEDIKLARMLYERTHKEYFKCSKEDEKHIKKCYHESLYLAFEFLNLSKSERERILRRQNILEDDYLTRKECAGR